MHGRVVGGRKGWGLEEDRMSHPLKSSRIFDRIQNHRNSVCGSVVLFVLLCFCVVCVFVLFVLLCHAMSLLFYVISMSFQVTS